MEKDIGSRADIDELMLLFYLRAMADPVIGHFFGSVTNFDLQHHLPVIGDFWESLLFGSDAYRLRNRHPLFVHADIDRRAILEPHHFQRWLELFTKSVDELFTGIRAEFIKQRGHAIARRMQDFVAEAR